MVLLSLSVVLCGTGCRKEPASTSAPKPAAAPAAPPTVEEGAQPGLAEALFAYATRLQDAPYHTSADGKTEVLYVFDDEALFLYHLPSADDPVHVALWKARPGPMPEVVETTGDELLGSLVSRVDEACWIQTDSGEKRLLLVGLNPPAAGDTGTAAPATPMTCFLLSAENIHAAADRQALAQAVPEAAASLRQARPLKAADFFAQTAQAVKAAAK